MLTTARPVTRPPTGAAVSRLVCLAQSPLCSHCIGSLIATGSSRPGCRSRHMGCRRLALPAGALPLRGEAGFSGATALHLPPAHARRRSGGSAGLALVVEAGPTLRSVVSAQILRTSLEGCTAAVTPCLLQFDKAAVAGRADRRGQKPWPREGASTLQPRELPAAAWRHANGPILELGPWLGSV